MKGFDSTFYRADFSQAGLKTLKMNFLKWVLDLPYN